MLLPWLSACDSPLVLFRLCDKPLITPDSQSRLLCLPLLTTLVEQRAVSVSAQATTCNSIQYAIMAAFSGSHEGVLKSLLDRLEGVTSRLEGLQVRMLTRA